MNTPPDRIHIPSVFSVEPVKLDNLDDLETLVHKILHGFEGQPDDEQMRQRMYSAMNGIAGATVAAGILCNGAAVQFPVSWERIDYGTEIVFEISEEFSLRVWSREKDDTSGRIIKMLFQTRDLFDPTLEAEEPEHESEADCDARVEKERDDEEASDREARESQGPGALQ